MGIENPTSVASPERDIDGYIPVELGGKEHLLPWVNVGDAWIAYFDPREAELQEAGAEELVRMLEALHATTIVTPSSSKSEPMVQEARDRLQILRGQQIDLVTLTRGKLESDVMRERLQNAKYLAQYSPITAGGESRLMVVSPEQVAILKENASSDPDGIVMVDDVYSTGNTIRAIRELLGRAIDMPNSQTIPTVTVMRECLVDANRTLQERKVHKLYYATRTPVVPTTGSSDCKAPRGYVSEPFINRIYTPGEIEQLKGIERCSALPDFIRRTARLALSGMYNLSSEGVFYLGNSH